MTNSYFPTVRYWLEVESLVYPDLPRTRANGSIKTCRYQDRMPWEAQSGQPPSADAREPARGRGQAGLFNDDHKYFVYFGLVDRAILEHELRAQYRPPAPDEHYDGNQARPDSGRTFLCAVEVDAHGMPDLDTLQVAAFAVAFAAKKHGTRMRHDELEALLADFAANRAARAGGGVDGAWFAALVDTLCAQLAWGPAELMAREQLCVQRVTTVRKDGKPLRHPPELAPINSFYVEDLERIADAAERGEYAPQVARYLDGERSRDKPGGQRIDVTRLDVIDQLLHPARFPAGRWPSRFPLFMMQQVAVNGCFETVRDGGIFSVNGPPGTGKTTLLMDVIAARIVERATLMAGFDDPAQAFAKGPGTIAYPAFNGGAALAGSSFAVDERLLDFGIVVASSNNNAVENITRDLPSAARIDPALASVDGQPFDYFAATADAVLAPAPKAAGEGEDETEAAQAGLVKSWGLISVPLGKKANRNRAAFELGRHGMFGIARALEGLPLEETDWTTARRRFAAALHAVQALQAEIVAYDRLDASLRDARKRQHAAAAEVERAGAAHGAARQAEQVWETREQDIRARRDANLAEHDRLEDAWGFFRRIVGALLGTRGYAGFQAQRRALDQGRDALRTEMAGVKRGALQYQQRSAELRRAHEGAQAAQAAAQAAGLELERERTRLRAALGEAAFDPAAFAALPVEEQHKRLPRSNARLHAARAALFVEALRLQRAFVKNAGKAFETNFRLALAMLEGQPFLAPHLPAIAPHLWATFFMVVPVVSSTFASFARCFKDLGEGQLGLLLVDEAGQAVPAHALGAFWRSRRALVVGDPLQVEPVIRMDAQLDLAILAHHGAPERHALTRWSAQHLADRGNRFGAEVVQHDGAALWVGSPLRVHRRCAEPMFSLSNRIAYNGKMVDGMDPAQEAAATAERPLLGPSRWIHVDNDDFVDHFNRAEGQAALELVLRCRRQGATTGTHGLPDLFVVSPFVSAADGVAALLRERQREWAGGAGDEVVAEWLKTHVGTVHTFQGKECDTVLFVLGGRSGRARQWAGSRPNIVNVAVTRARRRLVVIGNRDAWRRTVFGAALAEALPG
ncbi:hypothetical protein HH212_23200 [Massilia forsythiae]|uniref:DNA2/NAM7 helicase-like C-terminal domain-containing protein n=1 Tax=Massilia forsythiae TaxID=2728020 RepID=A0A7Z2W0L4_9BURK|nr:DEAD/DEAH box helicase [Massilia forsythiae]QJE02568.1 hypothetical protein HH212_23200 [Massilia forsythiae]